MADEDWDDSPVMTATPYVDPGRSFGRGRGFVPVDSDGEGDECPSNNDQNNFGSGGYGGRENRRGGSRGGRGDGRGRGRGEGRGRGGRGGFGGTTGSTREDKGDGAPDKPRDLYIPPDPTEDEEQMFSQKIISGINFDKYDNIKVKVTGENAPRPISNFEGSGLRNFVLENVRRCDYVKPTPVQKNAVPIVLSGRDLMACAQTGSGKTAAFLLPMISLMLSDPRDIVVDGQTCEPQAVIISPTRELTLQIFNEARKFAYGSVIRSVVVYGGTASFHQARQVMRGCHILVATPGRLLDFVNRGHISFGSVRFVVLDEADRMLDMGFMPDVEKMMSHPSMPQMHDRQTLMFSATFPEEIQRLATKFLKNDYLFLAVGIVGGACSDVEQKFYQVQKFDKRNKLTELLHEGGNRILVFVETKRTADFLAALLSETAYPTTSIHGDRLQREREIALADFKTGRMQILVATAVAARGLDINNVTHVINYDLPSSIDEYVHRIGRTGRVGNRGKATSLYDSENDSHLAAELVKILKQANQEVPSFLEQDSSGGGGSYPSRPSNFGGRDIRKFNNPEPAPFVAQDSYEPEEEW